jgi:hypothetical protein
VVAGEGVSFCFGGLPGLSGLGFAGFACGGGTAGVAGAAGFGAGGLAGCARTAGIACVVEWRGFFALACCWPPVALPPPFELVDVGEGEAVEVCPATVDGPPEGVPLPPAPPPPPGLGWPGTGAPGTGTATPPPGPWAAAPVEPFETNTWVKPVNGEGDTVGFALDGLAGSTSAGTLRSCVPGRVSSRIEERSSTEKACIQSCADATAPAVTAPT